MLDQGKLQTLLGSGTVCFLDFLPSVDNDFAPVLHDVKLSCKDGVLLCHSFFLKARSSYFRKILDKANTGVTEMPPLPVSRKSVLQVLRFLYSDIVCFDHDDLELQREVLFVVKQWKIHALEPVFAKLTKSSSSSGGYAVRRIWDDLGNALISSKEHYDVIFEVEGKQFHVHKVTRQPSF